MFNQLYQTLFPQQQNLGNGLFVVSTPIGNLADITFRALYVLQNCHIIICEDTSKTLTLLNFFGIKNKKTITYNDHSNEKTRKNIINLLQNQKTVAFVSDAGTPLISDPGYKLIRCLQQLNFPIYTIPGCCAAISAISIAGIACDQFLFAGFLPEKQQAKIIFLQEMPTNFSLIFFETAKRLLDSLNIMLQIFGDRTISVAKELTKIHEQIKTGQISEVLAYFNENQDKIKGEIVLLLEKSSQNQYCQSDILQDIGLYLPSAKSSKDLAIQLASKFNTNKKNIYQLILQHQAINNEK
jgi:16S rRNA (cytidine1402-2'-O)-methyltransferase